MRLEEIRKAVEGRGLALRGGFHPNEADMVPALADGGRPGTILLLGNVDPSLWQAFREAPEGQVGDQSDSELGPLDRWSLRVISELATDLDAEAAFPFGGPPYFPFQRWAQRSEPVWPSPLGMLIHRDYGLWHAYRGALCFRARLDLPAFKAGKSPCETCVDQPCLSSCPVDAFSDNGYDVPRCAGHLETPAGADCLELGCRARRACPVGVMSRYIPEQAAFHMSAFLAARRLHGGGTE